MYICIKSNKMHKLSERNKKILESLANIYSKKELMGSGKYFSKKSLRRILSLFKWDKSKAIEAIEKGDAYYYFYDDGYDFL